MKAPGGDDSEAKRSNGVKGTRHRSAGVKLLGAPGAALGADLGRQHEVLGLLAELPPDRALRAWMDRFADYIATKREMADALRVLIAVGTVTRS